LQQRARAPYDSRVIRAPIPDLVQEERRVEGPVAHYLGRVLRLHAGDTLIAFDPLSGREADALVVRAERGGLVLRLGPVRTGSTRQGPPITLVQGLAKGDKCDAIVRDATELGATRIVVALTKRSVVRLDPKRAPARRARWARIAQEAARQSGRSDCPRVELASLWAEAIASVEGDASRFCLWERAEDPLGPPLFAALASGKPLAFACGPEGGLEHEEVEAARACGWTVASLGPRALRTETVAAAVLGAVCVWITASGAADP
jgi:16S rRNA (uracil1498-N3)-methyltransferase